MNANEAWRNRKSSFFCHRECESFPCHTTDDADNFNCLFCYCPLYALGENCGGNFKYSARGVKDCSCCTLPHERDRYGEIMNKLRDAYCAQAAAAKDAKS